MKLVAKAGLHRGGRTLFADCRSPSSRAALLLLGPERRRQDHADLRTLAGLLPPAAGRICLEGGDAERGWASSATMLGISTP